MSTVVKSALALVGVLLFLCAQAAQSQQTKREPQTAARPSETAPKTALELQGTPQEILTGRGEFHATLKRLLIEFNKPIVGKHWSLKEDGLRVLRNAFAYRGYVFDEFFVDALLHGLLANNATKLREIVATERMRLVLALYEYEIARGLIMVMRLQFPQGTVALSLRKQEVELQKCLKEFGSPYEIRTCGSHYGVGEQSTYQDFEVAYLVTKAALWIQTKYGPQTLKTVFDTLDSLLTDVQQLKDHMEKKNLDPPVVTPSVKGKKV